MSWQDVMLGIVQWAFTVALLPSIFGAHKPELKTSFVTGVLLLVQTYVLLTLALYFGALCTFVCGCAWFVLAWQRWRLRPARPYFHRGPWYTP